MKKEVENFLNQLNKEYLKLHKSYEDLFWVSYMYDNTVNSKKDTALGNLDAFRSNKKHLERVNYFIAQKPEVKLVERLKYWQKFFNTYQTPDELVDLKNQINALESKIQKTRADRKQGYIDPKTKKFVSSSINEMKTLMSISDDETIRKACFDALQNSAVPMLDDFLKLVSLRNEYAKKLGFDDFYAYKLMSEEGMTKTELFKIFDDIYTKTKYGFAEIRKIEKTRKGIRKPWNFNYMFSGSFIKEEDPYHPIDQMLYRWGKSFQSLDFDFDGGTIQLDLLERQGKYNNGFCHWPNLVSFENGKKISGSANFTCNITPGKIGEVFGGMNTLFHEGGHAAHMLNSQMQDACINNEYPPTSTAWAETQSMFTDSILSSIEWRMRYAKTSDGKQYPFDLYERKVNQLQPLAPLDMMGLMMVVYFEKALYEDKNLTKDKIIKYAQKTYLKYTDRSVASSTLLEVPHIYSWESSCSYHGYGLAELALTQWRQYFYKKYGYIVDNPNVGKEMKKVWVLAASKTFPEFVKLATSKKLSAKPYVDSITATVSKKLKVAKERIKRLEKVKQNNNKINLKATIKMVHGKKVIATNKKSFEDMALKYAKWLKTQ
jgi:Zn-dependent oligopeptidase